MNRIERHVNVAVVGGGVVGGSLVNKLVRFTDIPTIALFEMGDTIGNLNSKVTNNSGTIHDGSTEHYKRDKVVKVKADTDITVTDLKKLIGVNPDMYRKGPKFLLGVGDEECDIVSTRSEEFSPFFPEMELIYGAEIARREPMVMKGRNPKENVVAISNPGYTIDFGLLAQWYVNDAVSTGRLLRYMNTRIMERQITRIGDKYLLTDSKGFQYTADVVIFATGAYSLIAAKALGLGQHLGILPIGGNFYDSIVPLLIGKVYTVQNPKRPFAAVHGDAEMHNPNITRFGPTAIVLPTLVDGDWSTVMDFLRVSVPTWDGVATLTGILADPEMLGYMAQNMSFQLPLIGKDLFTQSARKIIPSLQSSQLVFHKGRGLRPQLVDTIKRTLELGDTQVVGPNFLGNIAPSPGASIAPANALRDTKKVIEFFQGAYSFNTEKYEEYYGTEKQSALVG
ncbi:MAG: FAD-dependent oxidoreductase [bacterium]